MTTTTYTPSRTAPVQRRHVALQTEQRLCDAHGGYTATQWGLDPAPVLPPGKPVPSYLRPFWGSCAACDESKQREADNRDAEIRGGVTERDRLAGIRRAALGIPARFADSTIDNWLAPLDAQKRVRDTVQTWLQHFDVALQSGRSLAFTGPSGTGKTRLAAAALRYVSDKGGTGLYTTALDLVGDIRASYAKDAERSEREVVNSFVSVDLLVVDEVGRQLETVHEREMFFRVLDGRYRACKPTVLVSNLDRAALVAYLGDAIADRLREGGGSVLVFDWASHRSARKGAQ